MGKSRLVRITNRGSFPRWRLESVGSTSKRDKMADASQGGWFGSGTKIAPIAALALKMEVWVTSTDSEGPYLVSYDIERRLRDGEDDSRVVRVYHDPKPQRDVTEFSPDAFINWSKPIGDDDKNEFRVWREYFRNAKDADGDAPHISDAPQAAQAPTGMTTVFLTRTREYEAIMRHVNRYFKYLSTDAPIFVCKGVGQFWPKSEEGTTRMFSQGTMALCHDNRKANWSTFFDYSFDDKGLMSEERTFENLNKVYIELARMLCAIPSTALATDLLKAIVDGEAELERIALGQVWTKRTIIGKEFWKAAWHALYGDKAVIAVGSWIDQYASLSFGRKPVTVTQQSLKSFLKLCGVLESTDVVPVGDRMGYRVILPTREELDLLEHARSLLVRRFPEVKDVPIRVFEPLTKETDKGYRAFVQPAEPPFKEVYVKRSVLVEALAHSTVRDRLRDVVYSLKHEFRHVRSGAKDCTFDLEKKADVDETEMFLDLYVPPDDEGVLEFDLEDFKTDPGVPPKSDDET